MIVSSRMVKVGTLSMALVAHGAIALTLSKPAPPQIEGASGGAEVRLGTSFADMSAGRITPERSEDTTETAEPEKAAPVPARDAVERADSDKTDADATTDIAKMAEPDHVEPEQVRDVADKPDRTVPLTAPEVSILAPRQSIGADFAARPLALLTPETGLRLQATILPEQAEKAAVYASLRSPVSLEILPSASVSDRSKMLEPSTPGKTAMPAPAEPASAAPETTERLTGQAPVHAAVTRSLRPRMRTPEFDAANKPAAKPRPKAKAKPVAVASGGANRNARAGAPTGSVLSKSATRGTEGRKAASGNAAASNYPGVVMRKLSRARRPNVNARGKAVVSFTIGANGGLVSVSLSGSSGSSALDRGAVQVVRNAAPFPRPPSGARRSYSVEIKGR
ncbi:energy transducer TonB family protein [Antarctobacter jejuensis]|uniref:energy transducer TonB family protein n=1 Tax=Antarctobacter jejuensis TaxID=1439938 RepID=UPI003FD5C295